VRRDINKEASPSLARAPEGTLLYVARCDKNANRSIM